MKKSLLFILFITTLILSQNSSAHIWSGISVSTSDNLDALNLNPAGLGINRGNQYALVLKQIPELDDEYYFGFTSRNESGFSTEIYYDEESVKYSFGYGFSIYNNLYAGFKYQKEEDYSVGFLYRPINAISIGTTLFSNAQNDDYDYLRTGIALRPFTFKKISNSKNSFLQQYILKNVPKNLTLGYDKISSGLNSTFQEQYFASLTITPGIDFSYFTFKNQNGNTYGINISFNVGKNGIQINNYPSNSYLGSTTASNSIAFFNYSQKTDTDLDFSKGKKTYIKMDLDGYFIEEKPKTSPFDFVFDINPFPFSSENIIGTQLKKWIDDLDIMTEDKDIDGMVIYLGNVRAGMAKREEMFNALMRFKSSGKKIIVYTDKEISGANYHLISIIHIYYLN